MPSSPRTVRGLLLLALTVPAAVAAQIQVAPDNGAHADPMVRLANTTGNQVGFTITNLGADASFVRTCTFTGNITAVTCSPLGLVAGGGGTKTVTATFTTSGAGTGSVKISVTYQGGTTSIGAGNWDETIVIPAVTVTPDASPVNVAPNVGGQTQVFTVSNTSAATTPVT